ncbi:glutamate--cysteine ligase [Nocardioides aestuarii]|uniref:Putative glutamate--cysteine ligase 2 n=1 Tax=Nocardioides aestuarii TaxID=252231 RepID=A0ABW4TS80_9ACTN
MTRTLGVEEELLLVDGSTGEPLAVAGAALRTAADGSDEGAGVEGELMQQQLETGTAPVSSVDDLLDELARWRAQADEHARSAGARVVALPTSPLPVVPRTTPDPRYREIAEEFGITQAEQLVCGMHVHVSTSSEDEAVGALDRLRPWLPVLTALSAGSPFWQGVDTGYASFRSQLWRRWPSAGSPGPFGTPGAYHGLVAELVDTGAIVDAGMAYFDVRLASDYPTIEVRVADVCPRVEVSAAVAVLARALVERAAADWAAGEPAPDLTPVVASLMTFRAARSGLAGDLVDPVTRRPRPAADVVAALVDHVAEPLAAYGDRDLVDDVVASLLAEGTAADRHRRVAGDDRDLAAVVRDTVALTHAVR